MSPHLRMIADAENVCLITDDAAIGVCFLYRLERKIDGTSCFFWAARKREIYLLH